MKSMKIILGIMVVCLITSFTPLSKPLILEECEIANIYIAQEVDSDAKVITDYGDLEEIELILIPARLDEGTYEIEVTRKTDNIYKIEGTDYYIETRYCYEYATYDNAILKIESNYGYNKGTIFF